MAHSMFTHIQSYPYMNSELFSTILSQDFQWPFQDMPPYVVALYGTVPLFWDSEMLRFRLSQAVPVTIPRWGPLDEVVSPIDHSQPTYKPT